MIRSRWAACAALSLLPVCMMTGLVQSAPPAETAELALDQDAPAPNAVLVRKPAESRLETILREWETASSNRRRVEMSFSRFKYDPTWQIEERGAGSLGIDADGRGYYEVTPVTINPTEQSRKSSGGVRYTLRSAGRYRWHIERASIIRVNDAERTFVEVSLPLRFGDAWKLACVGDSSTEHLPDGGDFHPDPPALPEDDATLGSPVLADVKTMTSEIPRVPDTKQPSILEQAACVVIGIAIGAALSKIDFDAHVESDNVFPVARPLLLQMSTAELRKQFHVKLLKETASEAWLEFNPTKSHDGQRAILILSLDGCTPVAIKQFDPIGTQTVHVFKDVRINPADACFFNRCARPNLKGYRQL